jgi:hypothetical protein
MQVFTSGHFRNAYQNTCSFMGHHGELLHLFLFISNYFMSNIADLSDKSQQ